MFAVVVITVPWTVFWMRGRVASRSPQWITGSPVLRDALRALAEAPAGLLSRPRVLLETVPFQFVVFLLDAATLDVMLRAVATPADAGTVFISFIVASLAATLAWVPGGLGAFDGTCIAMLHVHEIPLEAALAATLLLRGFTFWLPMLPGLWLARRELRRPK
jgi:uncharacterized protein (TIRG00374 family)